MEDFIITNLNNTSYQKCNQTNHDGEWQGISRVLWIYISPIIFITGVIGNAMIFAVIRKPIFKDQPPSTYLFLLALADTSVLIFGYLPEWLSACHIFIFKSYSSWSCKIDKFVSYFVGDISVWILTSFTINRFIGICYPKRYIIFGDTKHTKLIFFGLLMLAIVKNIHVWWTRGPEKIIVNSNYSCIKTCGRPEPFSDFERYVRPWIAFTLVICIPFILMYICNICIIVQMFHSKRLMKQSQLKISSQDNAKMQVVWMCMSASLAFTILISPSIILLIGKPHWDTGEHTLYMIAKSIANQMTYVNHSINFILYCLTGKRFREELRKILTCYKRQLTRNYHFSDS